MTLDIRIEGAANLHKVAAQIRAEGRKDLGREMSKALNDATAPVRDSIRSSADETMPRSGGYAAAFDSSLRFKTSRRNRANEATLTLATYAEGASDRRDIGALEGGKLRHPVHGRSRPGKRKGERVANPWAVTKIRAGFWKRGTDGAIDQAQEELTTVIDGLAERLAGK